MRKAYIYSAIIAIVFSSCAKQQSVSTDAFDSQIVPPGKHIETVFAGPMTKTTYTGANETEFHWQAGDKISVLYNNSGVAQFYEFEAVSSTDSWVTATFRGYVDDGATLGAPSTGTKWALYPANSGHTYASDTDISFNMPAGGDGNTAKIPMIAKGTGDSFQFHHLCGAMKFTYTGLSTDKVKVYFKHWDTGKALTGKFNIQALGEDITHAYIVNDKFVDNGSQSNETCVYADVKGGTAIAFLPLPLSSSIDRTDAVNPLSRYWASYYFKVEDGSKAGYELLPEYTVKSGSVDLYKGKITPITSKSLATAITIDGDLSDWSAISAFPSSADSRIREWKIKTDANFVYFYAALRKNRVDSGRKLYIGFETDNNSATGSSGTVAGMPVGLDAYAKVVPFTNDSGAATLIPVHGLDVSSQTYAPGKGSKDGSIYVWDYDDSSDLSSDSNNAFIELRIPRSQLYLPASGSSITVNCSYDSYVAGPQTITLE